MTMSNSQSNSPSRLWRWCGIIAVVVICIVIAFVAWVDHTIGKPMRIKEQIGDTIASLAKKCPPDMTQREWNVAVSWTNNLAGNCFWPGGPVDLDDMRRFQHELEERAKGKVDMDLIIWIWDQVAKITPHGLQYKRKFQFVMFEDMQLNSTFSHFSNHGPFFEERHDLISQIDATIRSLATKCPPDLTQDQWHIAISRTTKLPRNPVLAGRDNLDDLRRFQRELDEKARGQIDMELIDWIWDEYAKLSPAAQEYKQKFQRAMLEDMQQSSVKPPI
jgi:hypothetical protein